MMQLLYNELRTRFPEIQEGLRGNFEQPSLAMGAEVDYLVRLNGDAMTPELISRVVDFSNWCCSQQRGETAADDIATIYVVSLVEQLFRHAPTRALLPRLMTREELLASADNFKNLVSPEDFDAALKEYSKRPWPTPRRLRR
jgi:hypothetical protein